MYQQFALVWEPRHYEVNDWLLADQVDQAFIGGVKSAKVAQIKR